MKLKNINLPPKTAPLIILLVLISFSILLQFTSPNLYGVDGYYHVKVASLIKTNGLHYNFRWAKFSTFSNTFADKDLVLHLIILPFTYISNIIIAGKWAAVFISFLFKIGRASCRERV